MADMLKAQVGPAAGSESRTLLKTITYTGEGDVATTRWSGLPATCPIVSTALEFSDAVDSSEVITPTVVTGISGLPDGLRKSAANDSAMTRPCLGPGELRPGHPVHEARTSPKGISMAPQAGMHNRRCHQTAPGAAARSSEPAGSHRLTVDREGASSYVPRTASSLC